MLRTEVVQEVAQEVGREGGRRGESGGCAPSAVGRLTVTEMLELCLLQASWARLGVYLLIPIIDLAWVA